MDSSRFLKRAALVFLVALAGYFLLFNWIEHRRVARGPWQVEFSASGSERKLVIQQANLGITNVSIVLTDQPSATNFTQRVAFTRPQNVPYPLPFGRCVFQDILFQPGTVVIEVGGHELQLMPRMLTIDRVERPWRSGELIRLGGEAAIPIMPADHSSAK